MRILDNVKDAIDNNRFANYLKGTGKYHMNCADDINDFECVVGVLMNIMNKQTMIK